jgi:hypothetical protein
MEENYGELKKELFAKREQLRALTLNPKILGDYHEELIRDFVSRFIDDRLSVKHGLIYDDNGQRSRECDVIIYEKGRKPLLESGNLVIVNEVDVRFVLQVKSKLTSRTLKSAINNLKQVKKLNDQIMCWIVGFETKMLFKTLYLEAWRSGAVQFLHVFNSEMKKEDKLLGDNQMRFFVNAISQCGNYPKYGYTNDLVIYQEGSRRLALTQGEDEQNVKNILSEIYSIGFWDLWKRGNNVTTIFEMPS